MIFIATLIGAAIIASGVIAKYWNNIKDWLIRGARKVKEIIEGAVIAVKIAVKKTVEAYEEISRHYSQDQQGKWTETLVSRSIDPSEIPADILAKAPLNVEKEVTSELELVLS